MDNLTYLNQISQSNRPTKRHNHDSKSFNSLLVKIIIGGIVLFFLLMALGAMLGNLGGRSRSLTEQVYVRSNNLNSVLTTYTPDLKSSQLRAIGYSLSAILTNGTNQLNAYLNNDGESKDQDQLISDTEMLNSETSLSQELELSLSNAKLNGLLDRTYETQINLQVSLLLSLTSQLLERSKDDAKLYQIVSPFHNSLQAIHDNLESYSGK